MSKIPAVLVLLVLGLALQAPTLILAATGDTAPGIKSNRASSPAASVPATDVGSQDPVDFPRASGLVRISYSQATGKLRNEEIAIYHARAGMDEVAVHYLEQMSATGWKKISDSTSGSELNRIRMIEWHQPQKEAEVRFYAAKSGSALRVRIFTYKRTPPNAAIVDTAPATATPPQASAAKSADKSKAMGAAPLGPPPTDINIGGRGGDAAGYEIWWKYSRDYTGANVYVDGGSAGWITLAENSGGASVTDHAFVPPNTNYKVVLHYADGSEGTAIYSWANPPKPDKVTGLMAYQTGPGRIHVAWDPMAGTDNARVFVSTLGPGGMLASKGGADLTGLPAGICTVRVASRYDGRNNTEILGPEAATVSVTLRPDRVRYRIVLLGVECEHETADDPLQLDGKHDEIYAGAYWATVKPYEKVAPGPATAHQYSPPHATHRAPPPRYAAHGYVEKGVTTFPPPAMNPLADKYKGGPAPVPGGFVRTKVMGDTNFHPGRVPAGTASNKGGIQTGDFVPSSACTVPQPGVAAASDRFPLLLWEGELTYAGDYLVVSPVLFEWDNGNDKAWNLWKDWWSGPSYATTMGELVRAHVGGNPGYFHSRLSGQWLAEADANGYRRPHDLGPSFETNSGDRPIDLQDDNPGMLAVPHLILAPYGLVFSRAAVESALGDKAAIVITENLVDDSNNWSSAKLEGRYTLYIQIERLPAATAVRP